MSLIRGRNAPKFSRNSKANTSKFLVILMKSGNPDDGHFTIISHIQRVSTFYFSDGYFSFIDALFGK